MTHPDLEKWRANVGAPVALDSAPLCPDQPDEFDVLCWNVAIGKGRLLERIRAHQQLRARVAASRPFVVLVQEAFRADASVPDVHGSRHHGGQAPRNTREDIVDVARALNLSLRYSPSMRNGRHQSDRGNAILSSVAIDSTHDIVLPYVRQRRAAIAVTVKLGVRRLILCTAHLDTHGRHRPHPMYGIREARRGFGGGRADQASALCRALAEIAGDSSGVVIGGDMNSYLGLRDPAVRALTAEGFRHSERVGKWRHTFHGPIRLMLDHVMFRPGSDIRSVHVRRIDEGIDRGRRVFGSDHHPLLATLTLG
jgi:endonuclease/exonuclease/phosphatase family metal-dependent hydrolase